VFVLVRGERLSFTRRDAAREVIDETREQRLFVHEVVMDQCFAHTGVARDVAQRQRGGTGRRDLLCRRVEDPRRRGMISICGSQS
jgi:hypothetical protein